MKLMNNTQWDFATIFATDQAWEEAAASLAADIKAASHYAGHLLDSAQTLLDTTKCIFGIEPSVGKGLCLCPYEK